MEIGNRKKRLAFLYEFPGSAAQRSLKRGHLFEKRTFMGAVRRVDGRQCRARRKKLIFPQLCGKSAPFFLFDRPQIMIS